MRCRTVNRCTNPVAALGNKQQAFKFTCVNPFFDEYESDGGKQIMVNLCVRFAGLRFKNPVVAAAGAATLGASNMRKCIEAGVGAIETKTISFDPTTWPLQRPANIFLDKYGEPGTLVTYETAFSSPELGLKQIEEIKPIAEKKM